MGFRFDGFGFKICGFGLGFGIIGPLTMSHSSLPWHARRLHEHSGKEWKPPHVGFVLDWVLSWGLGSSVLRWQTIRTTTARKKNLETSMWPVDKKTLTAKHQELKPETQALNLENPKPKPINTKS